MQSSAQTSPPKWHLAHTSWFFEHFLLRPYLKGYRDMHPQFHKLFNSYYESEGEVMDKGGRGIFSRPSVQEILTYRRYIDEHMARLLEQAPEEAIETYRPLVELGLAHEEQHQELLYYDIKHNFFVNPLKPAYDDELEGPKDVTLAQEWVAIDEGLQEFGHQGNGFAFDNESPVHKSYLEPFALQRRQVTNGEFQEFIEAGGYEDCRFWHADGWDWVRQNGIQAPLYWRKEGDSWREFTLGGFRELSPAAPVMHVSFYEAHAFATWKGVRLPSEYQWEAAARQQAFEGNFAESGLLTAAPPEDGSTIAQLYGDTWEWTASPYTAYPGYQPLYDGTGEYNGKFMVNQMVMRGGSCYSPKNHIRPTYRNFFYPTDRWQASGFRLAKYL